MNPMKLLEMIAHGDKVTILVPAGGKEWKPKTGRAVMRGAIPGSWVLNMGGRYGTPGVATEANILSVRKGG